MSVGRAFKFAVASMLPGMLLCKRRGGGVALTFDDGPHPHNTPRILEGLARHNAKATFFLLGSEVTKYPGLVREIFAEGHQVANHGYSHNRPSEIGTRAYLAEVVRTQHLLEDLTQSELRRDFRPPYGELTPAAFAALVVRGFRLVYWSIDSNDSIVKDTSALVSRVVSERVQCGDIVLFHEDYAHTATALPKILQCLEARQLGMTAIAAHP